MFFKLDLYFPKLATLFQCYFPDLGCAFIGYIVFIYHTHHTKRLLMTQFPQTQPLRVSCVGQLLGVVGHS